MFFTYVFLGINNYSYIDNKSQRIKNTNLVLQNEALIYLCLHVKLSTPLSQTQLCEIFAYEIPTQVKKTNFLKRNKESLKQNLASKSIVVYNFHSLVSKNRFFLFANNNSEFFKSKYTSSDQTVESISELFFAANWLERECSELSGISFSGKKDLRNLMLQYGDSSKPFLKKNPTIGFSEFIYDVTKDTVVQQALNSSVKTYDNYIYI